MNQSVVIVYEEFEDTKGESESVYRRSEYEIYKDQCHTAHPSGAPGFTPGF
jgi:hypothetical protein